VGHEQRDLRALPRRGDYLDGPGDRLYVVSQVVFVGRTIHIYAILVSEPTAAALEKSWSEWERGEVPGQCE
jgi:hypothetical protein